MKSILEELWYGNLCPEIVMGKMSGEEKNAISHRGKAIELFAKALAKLK